MLTALIIITLLSLLIATEAEPASRTDDAAPEPTKLPKPKRCSEKRNKPERLAA